MKYKNNSLNNIDSADNVNNENPLKITVTQTQNGINKPTKTKTTEISDISITLQPSITSPLGSSTPTIEDTSKIALIFSDKEYDPKRRNSAPNIVSPKAIDISDDAQQTFQHLVAKNKTKSKKRKHVQSRSLQTADLNNVLRDVKLPKLFPSNSEKPFSKSKDMLKKRGTNSPMYRGHISVKHPKRYKRKTAEEMQFAPEDIDIPRGIRNDANMNDHDIEVHVSNINERSDHERVESTEMEELKLSDKQSDDDHHIIDLNAMNDQRDSGDICPWTTYHGGMVYEDAEDGQVGNAVYFVGLIDILQKYNKRKKLENWIKKMKYNKNSISSVPADLYAQRMCDFFEDKVV